MTAAHALIVDDNLKNVQILARLLDEQGVTSTQLTQARQIDGALAELGQYSVVFVDLEMPGLNGFDVLERIKGAPSYAGAPVIAYTVHVSEINQAHQRGFDGFLAKPVDPDRFPQQLARILAGQGVWESA